MCPLCYRECNFLKELATLTGGTPAVPPTVPPTIMVEALRRRPAKPMGSPRVGSIPAPPLLAVFFVFSVSGVEVGAGG